MVRGGSRRFGKPWTVQPSAWEYDPAHGMGGPLMCTPKGPLRGREGARTERCRMVTGCRGIALLFVALAWHWRVWHLAWFAGAAAVTEEGPALGLFACNAAGDVLTDFAALTRHGHQAQSFQRTIYTGRQGTKHATGCGGQYLPRVRDGCRLPVELGGGDGVPAYTQRPDVRRTRAGTTVRRVKCARRRPPDHTPWRRV